MKKALALLLVFALLASTGCMGKSGDSEQDGGSKVTLTATEVRSKLIAATEEITDYKKTSTLGFTASITMKRDGMSMDMNMAFKQSGEIIIAGDPAAGYFKTTTVTTLFDEEETEIEAVYARKEDGEYVIYTHDLNTDSWDISPDYDDKYQAKLSSPMDVSFLDDMDDKDLTLARKTASVNGCTTYVLTAALSGEHLAAQGMDIRDLVDTDVDLSKLSFPMTIYVDTETFRPIRVTMKLDNLSDPLKQSLSAVMGDVDGATFEVHPEDAVMDLSYDGPKVPALPEEARNDASLSKYDPQQSDGSFIIFEEGAAARIVCTDGWEGTAIEYDHLIVCDDNYDYFIDFTMYPAMTKDELIERLPINRLSNEDSTYLSPIGEYEILHYAHDKQLSEYYAFTQMGDGWLVIYTYTYENEDMVPVLSAVLPMAEEYPYEQINRPNADVTGDATLTKAEVLQNLIEATDNANSRQCISTCDMFFALSTGKSDTDKTVDISISIDCEVTVSKEPFAGYTYGNVTTTTMGKEDTSLVQMYVVEEDSALVTYTKSDDGHWERGDATQEHRERLTDGSSFHYLTELKKKDLSLDENIETINGRDTYVLHCKISGSNLQNLGFDPSTLVKGGAITYPTTLYIDTETFLPVCAVVDVSKTVEALKRSLVDSVGGTAASKLEVTTSCDGYFIEFVYEVPAPKVPTGSMTA